MLPELWRRALHAMRAWTRPRRTAIELLGCRPLHGGGMLYVTDVDRRRFVFVTTAHAACLLASYRAPEDGPQRTEEEAAGTSV